MQRHPAIDLEFISRLDRAPRAHRSLSVGAFRLLSVDGHILVHERRSGGERLVVALKFSTHDWPLPDALAGASMLISTHGDRDGAHDGTPLRADEVLF